MLHPTLRLRSALYLVILLSPLCSRAWAQTTFEITNTNDNGDTTVTDAVEILLYLFRGGDALPSPFAKCGRDGTDDPLSCRAFVPCK